MTWKAPCFRCCCNCSGRLPKLNRALENIYHKNSTVSKVRAHKHAVWRLGAQEPTSALRPHKQTRFPALLPRRTTHLTSLVGQKCMCTFDLFTKSARVLLILFQDNLLRNIIGYLSSDSFKEIFSKVQHLVLRACTRCSSGCVLS